MKRSLLLPIKEIQSPVPAISLLQRIPEILLCLVLAAFSNSVRAQDPCSLNNTIQQQNVLCSGGNTGYIVTNVSGGAEPYTYFWSNGSQSANAVELTAGTYIVTVVDYLGCFRKDTIQILEPDPINLQLFSPEHNNGFNVSSYHGNDGSINLTISGGTPSYMQLWSNGAHMEDLSGLSAGTYSVTVTDANACTATASITLGEPSLIEMPSGYTPNSDGANDYFVIHGAENSPGNLLTIFNRWGNIVYQKENYRNEWNGFNNKGEELPEGTYFAIFEVKSSELVLKGYVEMKRD